MPNAKSLILCVHLHQPVGNFDHIFNEAYERSYKPFFDVLEKHPSIRLACHISGSLMDWLEKNKPEFFDVIKRMVGRGQIEIMGGAYYEPIYGAIPLRDLEGQILMMKNKLKAIFGSEPEGAWLTERVWDPHLVAPLKKAGIQYTVLDDFHLEKDTKAKPVSGYFRTRGGFRSLDFFASMKELRYRMPFRLAEEAVQFILSQKGRPEDVIVFADDCEKFGMWPGTFHWVYEEKWLDKFFTLIEKTPAIRLYTFSEFRKKFKPKKTVKVAHASYSEMMEWSGGRFYNFFNKYAESRYMRDRMWALSDSINRLPSKNGSAEKISKARKALYKAQCNCTYWHGVFGGLYLHHLRSAVFENLIQADRMAGEASHATSANVQIAKLDSGDRLVLRQKNLISFFNSAYGGALEELDFVPKSVNLMCNLQRRKEFYHESVLNNPGGSSGVLSIYQMLGTKEKNLEKHLYYDTIRRLSLLDHFFAEEITLDEFGKSSYKEIGDFVGNPYRSRVKKERGERVLYFTRNGSLEIGARRRLIDVTKSIVPVGDSGLGVRYKFVNRGTSDIRFVFGVEFNFSIGEKDGMKGLSVPGVRGWTFHDSWRDIDIRLETQHAVTLLAAPVETVSESEHGLERTYQQLAVLLQRPMTLAAKETREFTLTMGVR